MSQRRLLDVVSMTRPGLKHTLRLIEDLELMLSPGELQQYLRDCYLTTDETVIIDVICRNMEKANSHKK